MPFTPSGARVVSGHERACQRDQQDPCECLLPRAERGWCHSVSTFKSLSIAMAKGFYRDRATVFFSFLFPLMFLVVFGLIFRDAGAQKIKIGVVGDGPVITALNQTGALEFERIADLDTAVRKVRDGDLPAMVAEQGPVITLRYA